MILNIWPDNCSIIIIVSYDRKYIYMAYIYVYIYGIYIYGMQRTIDEISQRDPQTGFLYN